MPMKLFIGRLPDGTTKSDLLNYFEDYGEISDCYIPSPFRGFGFITFVSSETGRHVLNRAHIYKVSVKKCINLVLDYETHQKLSLNGVKTFTSDNNGTLF